MASPRRAHLLLTITVLLLLLCHLSSAMPLPSPSPPSNATSPSYPPPAPPVPKLPRGLPRIIPAWSLPVNPFTAKAAFIRYWNRKVRSNRPHPAFFFAKLSPLSAPDAAAFSTLASAGKLASRIRDFCAAASLLCPSTPAASWSASSPSVEGAAGGAASSGAGAGASEGSPAPFKNYENGNFSSYGNSGGGGADQFAVYSSGKSGPVDSFKRYGKGSLGRNDSFTNYEVGGNVGTSSFSSYTTGATGGAGEFAGYAGQTNTVAATFAAYDSSGNGREHEFATYAQDANAGVESFISYGKTANGAAESFKTYANNSNTIASGFINYGEKANGFNDTFASYGLDGNAPENTFRSYASGSNAAVDDFKGYRDQANMGDDSFTSYASNANGAEADFDSYGKSTNPGSVAFKGYGQGSNPNHRIGFTHYSGDNTTFKAYSNEGVEFKEYQNMSKMEVSKTAAAASAATALGHRQPKWSPEPGKFFRERDLMMGNRMPMPDIADKMPHRAFLPRDIATKIPFEEGAVSALFGAAPGTAMRQVVASTVAECSRAPSRGETKRCATSAEDVVDFAVEMLGSSSVAVRSTESAAGGGRDVRLGRIAGVAGGGVTRSVSCHQSLFPYMVYYCHSVPRVRLYEADILDVDSNRKINHGVAICHLDTSDWSPKHGAFVALGGKPGEIEVCHWIFQGDMTWTLVD
ncbi:BURP domain-containing protein 14-like [Panicum miliaceum]|uniref:BURP domain-containing protein 14-like n=1 Tax=Panicum miliaceum TaxID=4540 RepID=A0A3L6QRY3_PANMI|nr:BURP domain-containing protein 14-like [Panicum miliaceum]